LTVQHITYAHPIRSLNQAKDIADEYARATGQTMYVVYEGHGFYVAMKEELSTFFDGLCDYQIRYCTAGKVS
jgi:hypothetical protein